jgi:hypothetical protein
LWHNACLLFQVSALLPARGSWRGERAYDQAGLLVADFWGKFVLKDI